VLAPGGMWREMEARETEAPPATGVQATEEEVVECFIHDTGVVTQTGAGVCEGDGHSVLFALFELSY